jgi:hypothetical protein
MYIANSRFHDASGHWHMAYCTHCKKSSVWHDAIIQFPDTTSAPLAHPDLPTDLQADFEEARSVLRLSPRSATALLRLVLQKLCKELGEPGDNINTDIKNLVKKGLPVGVQQALDIIRVVGNEQVHPGQLDVRDNPDIAAELFRLINFIIEDRITRPKQIKALYDRLPSAKLAGIEERDAVRVLPASTDSV